MQVQLAVSNKQLVVSSCQPAGSIAFYLIKKMFGIVQRNDSF